LEAYDQAIFIPQFGARKIAARFGIDPSTVQRIARPFVGVAA
jgi:hypothetical protein